MIAALKISHLEHLDNEISTELPTGIYLLKFNLLIKRISIILLQ